MYEIYRRSLAKLSSDVGHPENPELDQKSLAEYEKLLRSLESSLGELNAVRGPAISAGTEGHISAPLADLRQLLPV